MKKVILPQMLLVTSGLPGSGKTKLSLNLEENSNIVHLGVDKVAYELLGANKFGKEIYKDKVIRESLFRLENILENGTPVIYDGNVYDAQWRGKLQKIADKYKILLICIYFNSSVETCRNRSTTLRTKPGYNVGRIVTEAQFNAKLKEFTKPNCKYVLELSGIEPFEDQLVKINKYCCENLK